MTVKKAYPCFFDRAKVNIFFQNLAGRCKKRNFADTNTTNLTFYLL